jgi:SPP1 family predicted phage head-tail adaptor
MRAGQLDQRVTIERLQPGDDDGYGTGSYDEWVPLMTTWAAVEPLSGREYLSGLLPVATVTTRIRLRYRPGIKSTDRVMHEDTVYRIQSVIDIKSARHELQLMFQNNPPHCRR